MLSATADTLFDKETAIMDIPELFADVRGRLVTYKGGRLFRAALG